MIAQRLTELVRDVLSAGPIGVVIVATPVVALALAVAGVSSKGQAGRVATFGALGALGLGALAAWAEVYGARARFVELTLHPERVAVFAKASWTAMIELARSLSTQAFTAGAALVLVPLVAVAAALTWARAEEGPWEKARAWTTTLALAAPVVLTAALLWTDAKDKLLVGEIRTPHERYDALMSSYDTLDAMSPWVIVAGAVVGLVVVAVVLAAGTSSRPLRITGAALGVVGIALFAATRARAADAAAPLSYLEGEPWDQDVALPLTNAPCLPVGVAPMIVLRPGRIELDGVLVKDINDLRRTLIAKRVAYSLSHSFGVSLGIFYVATSDPSGEDVRAVVEAAAEADHRKGFILVAPAAFTARTRTLGALERRRRACAERLPEPPPPRE